ncbi:DUF5000 domain-containing lipoprotein [Wocania ichthyoenteri]|uniref:DUF5000 domain-containing lipoprotein n=1 Tax=Wocania ichthyoenteri TaxID=1230531 RepID=UPI00053EF906|nr:DUF5000 domain-containing lipoprotein [Wocania ichthyoenteri]
MKLKIIVLIIPILLLFIGCEENEHEPISKSSLIPPKVENLAFTPINGGVDITYDLPAGKDLLYVKAVYTNSAGNLAEVKTSIFNNNIQILGFGDTNEKTIKVYTVTRSEVASEPVVFTVSPLTPPVFAIQQTIDIVADFGGAKFTWENDLNAPISVELLAEDQYGDLVKVRTEYTSLKTNKVSLRGYASVPTKFAAVIRDRYDNYSDTIYPSTPDKLLTPLFEELLDKSKMLRRPLQNDDNWANWGGSIENLLDNDFTNYAHTQAGNVPRPSIMTIDLGSLVTLSRFKLYQRSLNEQNFAFTHGNPKRYDVYGSKEVPGEDGNLEDWILLKECLSVKPSGLPLGQKTDEDIASFLSGDEFTFDDPVEIRYFRLAVHETWDGSGYINLSELSFWGSISN